MPNASRAFAGLLTLAAGVSFLCADDPKPKAKPKLVADAPARLPDESAVRAVLDKEIDADLDGQSVKDVCNHLGVKFGLAVRIDTTSIKRLTPNSEAMASDGPEGNAIRGLYETKLAVPVSRGMTVADALTEMCAQLPRLSETVNRWAYKVRNNTVLIGPAFIPMTIPGQGQRQGEVSSVVSPNLMIEQLLGEAVNFHAENVPLTQALADLRKRTGANIVLDVRATEPAKANVAGTFHDARLLTVLQTLSDMAGLKVVNRNNVFYVTSPENADAIQDEVNRDLFGTPAPPAPAGANPLNCGQG